MKLFPVVNKDLYKLEISVYYVLFLRQKNLKLAKVLQNKFLLKSLTFITRSKTYCVI